MSEFLRYVMLSVKTTVLSERATLQLLFSEFKDAFATQLEDIKSPSDLPEFSLSTISEDSALLGSRYKKKFPESERSVMVRYRGDYRKMGSKQHHRALPPPVPCDQQSNDGPESGWVT